MKNVFKGAKFGDKFLTRNGSKLMFVHYLDDIDAYHCVLENWYETIDYDPDVKAFEIENHPTDIVSKYQESIDEEELDDLATYNNPHPNEMRKGDNWEIWQEGFKTGYRKALELWNRS